MQTHHCPDVGRLCLPLLQWEETCPRSPLQTSLIGSGWSHVPSSIHHWQERDLLQLVKTHPLGVAQLLGVSHHDPLLMSRSCTLSHKVYFPSFPCLVVWPDIRCHISQCSDASVKRGINPVAFQKRRGLYSLLTWRTKQALTTHPVGVTFFKITECESESCSQAPLLFWTWVRKHSITATTAFCHPVSSLGPLGPFKTNSVISKHMKGFGGE